MTEDFYKLLVKKNTESDALVHNITQKMMILSIFRYLD